MAYGHQRFLLTSSSHQALIPAFQITVFAAGSPPSTLYQRGLKLLVAFQGFCRFFFPPLSLLPGLIPDQQAR